MALMLWLDGMMMMMMMCAFKGRLSDHKYRVIL
jgi:hypothetical protein